MKLTQNSLKARMEQIQKIEAEVKKLKKTLIDAVIYQQGLSLYKKEAFEFAVELAVASDGSYKDIDKFMEAIEGYGVLEGMEKGNEELPYPYLYANKDYPVFMEMKCPINTGGDKLVSYISESDKGTLQAGVMYETVNENKYDLCMAERKTGDLAEVKGYDRDNEDVDIYMWDDITQEDYTYSSRIKKEDIDTVDEELEGEGFILTE